MTMGHLELPVLSISGEMLPEKSSFKEVYRKASEDKDVGACRRRPLSTSMLLEEMKSVLC